MEEEKIDIIAKDGFVLKGTLREPEAEIQGVVQINSGTGIPQKFYRYFAAYLTSLGYVTITYDYRGIGESKPYTLRGFEATNLEWGIIDINSVFEWIASRYPRLKKIVVGHSMGGQLIGVMENSHRIDKAVLIAAGTGFWRDMPKSALKYLMPFLWYIYIPVTTFICGYGGAKKIRQGENLPKGVALQWRKWCTSKSYWEADLGEDFIQNAFSRFQAPIKSIAFTDDPIISERANKNLLSYFSNSVVARKVITPQTADLKKIGHFGFFSRKCKPLWDGVI